MEKEEKNDYLEYMKNNVAYMAEALKCTEKEVIECFKNEGFQDAETARRRKLLETANLKAALFRDKLLKELADWDRERPIEPLQFKYTIYVTMEPKK